VGGTRLTDSFQWDITCPDNSADDFAQVLLQELSLDSHENVSAVAIEIRRQIAVYAAQLSLHLKKNIKACVREDQSYNGEFSECSEESAAFAEF
jgi:hypothetical protein